MKPKKANRAVEFIARCIGDVEADGYQQWEGDDGNVPDGLTPDDWGWSDDGLWLKFGNDVYRVRSVKRRSR